MEVVEIGNHRRLHPLPDRHERGVTLKEIDREVEVLIEKILIVAAEEPNVSRTHRADACRRGQSS